MFSENNTPVQNRLASDKWTKKKKKEKKKLYKYVNPTSKDMKPHIIIIVV